MAPRDNRVVQKGVRLQNIRDCACASESHAIPVAADGGVINHRRNYSDGGNHVPPPLTDQLVRDPDVINAGRTDRTPCS